MRKSILIGLFALLIISYSQAHISTDFAEENTANEFVSRLLDNNPRGLVLRKGVKYKWELEKSARPNQYTLKIHKEHRGKSNLAYATTLVALDKRSSGAGYVVKIFHSINNSYRWDMDRKTMLRVTFKKDGTIDYQATGQMPTFEDNAHGLSASQLKEETDLDPRYNTDLVRHVSAAVRYLVFKYPKVMIR